MFFLFTLPWKKTNYSCQENIDLNNKNELWNSVFLGVILLHSNCVGTLGQVSIVSLSGIRSQSWLWVTWPRWSWRSHHVWIRLWAFQIRVFGSVLSGSHISLHKGCIRSIRVTSEFFSFNVWEWFLYSSVLEQIESNLSKINWLFSVFLLIPIVLVPWGRFPLCHTPIRPIFAFRDQISILIVGYVTNVITRFTSSKYEILTSD
jgi:hypothetical protein